MNAMLIYIYICTTNHGVHRGSRYNRPKCIQYIYKLRLTFTIIHSSISSYHYKWRAPHSHYYCQWAPWRFAL